MARTYDRQSRKQFFHQLPPELPLTAAPIVKKHTISRPPKAPPFGVLQPAHRRRGRVPLLNLTALVLVETLTHHFYRFKFPPQMALQPARKRRGRVPLLNLTAIPIRHIFKQRWAKAPKSPIPQVLDPAHKHRGRVPLLALTAVPIRHIFKQRWAKAPKFPTPILIRGLAKAKRRKSEPVKFTFPVVHHKRLVKPPQGPPRGPAQRKRRVFLWSAPLVASPIIKRHHKPHRGPLLPGSVLQRARVGRPANPFWHQLPQPVHAPIIRRHKTNRPPRIPTFPVILGRKHRGRAPGTGGVWLPRVPKHRICSPVPLSKDHLAPRRPIKRKTVNQNLGTPIAILKHYRVHGKPPVQVPGSVLQPAKKRRGRFPGTGLTAKQVVLRHRTPKKGVPAPPIALKGRRRRGRIPLLPPTSPISNLRHRRGKIGGWPTPALLRSRRHRGPVPNQNLGTPLAVLRHRKPKNPEAIRPASSLLVPARKRRGRFPGTGVASKQLVHRHKIARATGPTPPIYTGRKHRSRFPGTGRAGFQVILKHRKPKSMGTPPFAGKRRHGRVPGVRLSSLAYIPKHRILRAKPIPGPVVQPAHRRRAKLPPGPPIVRRHRQAIPKTPPSQVLVPSRKRRGRVPLLKLVPKQIVHRHKLARPVFQAPAQLRGRVHRARGYPVGRTLPRAGRIIYVTGSATTLIAVLGSFVNTIAVTGGQQTMVSQDISFPRGQDLIVQDTIAASGSIAGWSIVFRLKRFVNDPAPIIPDKTIANGQILLIDATNNVIWVTLASADTAGLPPGIYQYAIARVDTGQAIYLTAGNCVITELDEW